MKLLYLGISGVLHPSASLYKLVRGQSPWADGHVKYEGVPILASALAGWPDLKIMLTSTQPWAHGLESVLGELGPLLAPRVVGHTYEDITNKVTRQAQIGNGPARSVKFSDADYWRMNKAKVVATHVAWQRPERWVAVDDEDILWPDDVRQNQLVLTDGCVGLCSEAAQDRLRKVLERNFR
jgi:hypothetical protein